MSEPEIILTKPKFSKMIEQIANEKDIPFIDAIVWFCENNDMEIEAAAKLLTPALKKSVESEAIDLNFLKTKKAN